MSLNHHLHSCKLSLTSIIREPIEHLINISVLAIIITICCFGFSLNNSITNWKQRNIVYPQAVLYLDSKANPADIQNIEKSLANLRPNNLRDYKFISKEQGLAELQHDEQLKEAASATLASADNPLPDTFVATLAIVESSAIQRLNMQLNQIPMVDNVQIDINYASKVHDLLYFATQMGVFLEILFIIVLGLVVYNIIRLQMMLKNDAIHVSRLIGASDSFIMRPLIYYAIWQVTLASLTAAVLHQGLTRTLNQFFSQITNLVGPGFYLSEISVSQFILIWAILLIFTIFSVFLAVRWVFHNTNN